MGTTLAIVLPVFGLVVIGWVTGRTPLLSPEGVRGINNFVLYVAIPALLFRTAGSGRVVDAFEPGLALSFFLASWGLLGVAWLTGRHLLRLPRGEAVMFAMGTCYGNTVLIGVPLVLAAYGDAGSVPLAIIVALHSPLLQPVVILLIEGARGGDGLRPTLRATGAALVRNPILLAMAAGILWGTTGWPLPEVVERLVGLLAGAAGPTALFALGAALARQPFGGRRAGEHMDTAVMIAAKLIVHPFAVWLLAGPVFGLNPLTVAVATIMAALPVGATVFVLAQGYGVYIGRATTAVVVSTALAAVTTALLLGLFAIPRAG
ncbi:MAG: AEC family transporter [Alphaproteobacteria bacterium]|nr:AEC family transporter [Alphaproteobacteria bacterium]